MRGEILKSFGERFDTPYQNEIIKAINIIFQRQKMGSSIKASSTPSWTRIEIKYLNYIQDLLRSRNFTAPPSEVLLVLRIQFKGKESL